MAVKQTDIERYASYFFTFDKPVPYHLKSGGIVEICPVLLQDVNYFLDSTTILTIDKNSAPSVEILKMSYLQFLIEYILSDKANMKRFINILILCLKMKDPMLGRDENGKYFIKENNTNIVITGREFEDIQKIILYQNIVHYDDTYVNPELKKAMDEMDALKNRNYEPVTLERKMAIITAHCGLTKSQQMSMTYRSHCLLFEEICGEVEFYTSRNAILISSAFSDGKHKTEPDHWIYKKRKNKFDGYVTSVEDYTKSMGSDFQAMRTVDNSDFGNNLNKQFNNFNNK